MASSSFALLPSRCITKQLSASPAVGLDDSLSHSFPENDSDTEGLSDDIFGLVDNKVQQLRRAVKELNDVLEVTELQSYFNSVTIQLEKFSKEASERLEEVTTFCSWMHSRHHTPLSSTSAGYFSILPEEISVYVLSFLSVSELARVCQVSRYWRRLSEDDVLWQALHRTRWRDMLSALTMINSGGMRDSDDEWDEDNTELEMRCSIRKAKRPRRGWKERFIDDHRLEENWLDGRYSTKVIRSKARNPDEGVYCIKFDNSIVMTGSNDRTIKISSLDPEDPKLLHVLEGHSAEVRAVDFDSQYARKIVSGSRDRLVKVWDLNTGQCLQTMEGHTGPVKCIQLKGNLILSGSEDASMKLYDLSMGGKEVHTFRGHVWGVACLVFNDEYIVSGSRDRRVILWDQRAVLNSGTLASDTTNSTLSESSGSTLQLQRPHLRVLEGHSNTVRCVAFERNTIVSGSWDNSIKVWDRDTGMCKNTLGGHSSRVLCLTFDESKIVSGSVDNSIKVWDFERKNPRYSLRMHDAPIFYIRADRYGVLSGSRDTQVVSWDFYSPNEEDVRRTKECNFPINYQQTKV